MENFPDELVNLWHIACPYCHSELLNKNGKYKHRQRFLCLECGKTFTSYSQSLLNASKISTHVWNDVMRLIIHGNQLKDIEEVTGVSYVSLSKIRLKMLRIFYNYNAFDRLILNIKNNKSSQPVFIKKLTLDRYVLTLKDEKNNFNSKYVNATAFTKFENLVSLTNSKIITEAMNDNLDVIKYHDSLQKFLSDCRGIKTKYLNLYITFHTLRYQTSITETLDYLKSHISICLRPQI